jgi:hypothetical protein
MVKYEAKEISFSGEHNQLEEILVNPLHRLTTTTTVFPGLRKLYLTIIVAHPLLYFDEQITRYW